MWRFYTTVLFWILFNNGTESLDLRTIRHLAFFADRNPDVLMQRIVVYNKTREVFVAARNAIYHFDADLSLKGRTSTGPELDHIKCLHPTFPCDQNGVHTDNDNKVFLMYHSSTADFLLACGTLYQGMCRIMPVDNVNLFQWVGAFNDTKNFIAGKGSTVGFFAPGPHQAPSLYSASTYDGRPLAYSPVSVSSKILVWSENNNVSFLYSHESEISHTGVNFDNGFKRIYKIEYIYGFSYAGFSYFVTTQRVAVDSEVMETRLARVCQNDLQFFSYTEVPLRCQRGLDVFNLATAAYLGPASFSLKRKLKMSKEVNEILYITFGMTLLDHGSQLDKTKGSVVCSFPMDQVITFFTNATRECFLVEPRTYLLKHVLGLEKKCEKHVEIEVNDDFCGSGFNHFIEGRVAIPGGYRVYVDRHITSLAVTLQSGNSIAIMGTDQGEVIKEVLDKRSAQPLYILNIGQDGNGNNHPIESSNAFDSTHENIYFLTGKKVVKFPIGSCSMYTDCGSCLTSEDPLICGWCGNYCSHPHECENLELMVENTCPPIIFSVEPLYGPTDGGTEVTIRGDNFGSSEVGESDSNIAIKVAGVDCDIIQWEKEMLKCRTSHVVAESSGPVMVRVVEISWSDGPFDMNGTAYSLTNFSYVVPKLYGIHPSYGPMSGGTNVTLYGQNLDAGSSHIITTAKQMCANYSVSKNTSWCLTRALQKDSIETAGPIEIMIDEAVVEPEASSDLMMVEGVTLGKDFRYLPDPDIFKINPHNALVSGIINLTVSGVNLNSVAYPKMIVIVTSSLTGETYEKQKPCTFPDSLGFEMVCPTPCIDIPGLGLHAPNDRAPLVAHLAFQMDGMKKLRDLPVHSPSLSQLLYYPDPIFHDPVQTKNNDTHLEIKGTYLNLALTPRDVKVLFDQNQLCNVTTITKDSLFCSLPSTRSSANGSEHSIQVIIGHLKYDLGSVRLTTEATSYKWFFFIIPVIICIFVLLVMFYKKRQASKHGIAFSVSYFANSDEAGNRRRQQINDYQDLNGHRLIQRPSISPSETTCSAAAAEAQVNENYDISEETLFLLKSENILVHRRCLSLGEVLGEGYFGRVYKGQLTILGKDEQITVAVKTIHNGASRVEQDREAFLQEGLMMKDFHHHNVLTLIGVTFETNGSPMFIIPYMKYGDLFSFIRDENQNPTIKDFLMFGVDIAAGMKYLAGLKFVHRDLAARNCMLAEDYTVKVADFGLSRDIYERDYYSSDNKKKLPIKWMAPESLEKGTYSTKSDVWSYGVVLWELLTRGVLPYPGVDNWDLLHYLKSGRRMPQPSYCPDLLYQLMLRCWDFDSKKRPTFDELEEEVKGIITKLELPKRRVSLNVTYVNYPQPVTETSTSRTDDPNT